MFRVFLKLGTTSFGGPIAHLGYYRTEFVERRRWLDDREYGDLVALCRFLPVGTIDPACGDGQGTD
ncbi:MAG TPA: chromate transporter [Microlunatus sp.]|nr:chromate transporter [Microlunatus sp.]